MIKAILFPGNSQSPVIAK